MSVILKESTMAGYSSFMVEGCGDTFIPQFFLLGGFFDTLVDFAGCWHDKGSEMGRLKDDNIVIVLLSLVVVITSGEEISFLVLGPRLMMKHEVVLSKLSDPVCLSLVQILRESEILEVLVVHPDFYVLSGAHEVMAPFRKCKHDGEQFLVIDLIVSFHGAECL